MWQCLVQLLVIRKIQQRAVTVVVVIAVAIWRETLNLPSLFIKYVLIIYDTVPSGRSFQCSMGDRQINSELLCDVITITMYLRTAVWTQMSQFK